jgi:hypothetical protein
MPDGSNERTQQIEKKIDLDVTGSIALYGSPAGATTIAPKNLTDVMEFAKLMAVSGPCVRPAFRGSPGACLAIALQAFRTGADPFAVANKAYITTNRSGDEQIAYEAQYIHAVLNTSGRLAKRLRAIYSGAGSKRKCTIIGHVVGEEEPLEYESPSIEEIAVKNSPLWKGDPDQQLFYYSTRAWGRRHLPEVLLGMYTPDEIRGEVIDITPPRPRPEDYATEATSAEQTEAPASFDVIDFAGEMREYETEIEAMEALVGLIGDARSLRSLEGLIESNPTLAQYPAVIEAFKEQKETFKDPGNGQDRSGTGAQPFDPARGATSSADAEPEHPEGESTTGERSTAQELPAVGAATPAANTTNEHPRDDPKRPPRTETLQKLAEAKTPQHLLYWTRKAVRECRDPVDIDELWRNNEARYHQLGLGDQKEVQDLFEKRNRELSG